MSEVEKFQNRVRLQAFEIAAAWRCMNLGVEKPTKINGDLRQQLDRLAAIIDDFTRPMSCIDKQKAEARARYDAHVWEVPK